ncbi:MAG: V-type ATP synthase subunit I [Deltaproteobacteria bacterium]|nr:V-type ATP synthase subunit I [Deltaproteobacteria bacterium]
MQKVMIVVHRSQVSEVLETLQEAGLVQVLDAERSMVTKEWPELEVEPYRHRDLEDSIDRLGKAIAFLKPYVPKGQTSVFAPRIEIDPHTYSTIISAAASRQLLDQVEAVMNRKDKLMTDVENHRGQLEHLLPWEPLSLPLEELHGLSSSKMFAGLIPEQHFEAVCDMLSEQGAMVEPVAVWHQQRACIVVCLNEAAGEVQKVLRTSDFEASSFEGLSGRVSEHTARLRSRLAEIEKDLAALDHTAAELAKERFKLQVLADYHENLHRRIHTESTAPATEHTVFLEGWVRQKDYRVLEKLVKRFDACDIAPVEPGQDEEPPVEIDNGPVTRPFETITRLYGIPSHTDVDPTVFLAPFFALFFGLCLTDAGYGIVLTVVLAWGIKKMQGDKKALWMLLICSVLTILAGAITGSWFADTLQTLLPQGEGSIGRTLDTWRRKIMLFDPMEQPLIFIGISLALGYIQVLFGLLIGFFNHLRLGNIAAAVFEKLTWVIMLNSLLLFALAKGAMLPGWLGTPSWVTAAVMAVLIFWFTERNSGLAGRIGGGVFAVFSTVFYLGDMLSYVRLMALGMVTAGLGMAVNILTQLVMDVPYVGFILGLLLFVLGHTVNLALSLLSAFVHSLRLQFVEFFPKFFGGGGHAFKPLQHVYQHIMVVRNQNK